MSALFLNPVNQPLSNIGSILPGATLTFYETQTTTKAPIFDDDGDALINPVQADAFGRFPNIYLDEASVYRVVLKTLAGAVVLDVDPYTTLINGDDLTTALATKVSRYPANPYSTISTAYPAVQSSAIARWWNGTNIVPTIGDGGVLNGLANPTTTAAPSMWQMWTLFENMIYEPWKLAVSTGDTTTAASLVAMATSQWTYIKSKFTLTQIQQGSSGIVNTSDDGRLHAMGLCWVSEMTGAADALTAAEEFLWFTLTRFHDPLQTATNYAVSTPGGTAAKSDPNGILYAAANDTGGTQAYGYISSSNEPGFGLAALYLYGKNVTTKAACLSYAQSLYTLFHGKFLTPVPSDATKTAQYLVYLGLNLDPNVNAANNTAINGGVAQTGSYQVNQTYLGAQNAFYGKPVRGTSSIYLGGSCLYAAMCAQLFQITGTTAYQTDAVNVTNAIASTQGFGRPFNGLPYLIQARDPWSDGDNLPELVRRCMGLSGVDPNGTLKLAIVNSAKAVMAGMSDGYLTPDWFPREKGTGSTETWLDDGAAGYGGSNGGGQAKPTQMQTHGSSLGLVVAAVSLVPSVAALGSGTTAPVSIESLAAEVASLKAALDSRMPRKGGVFVGRVSFRVPTFYADLNNTGYPNFNWANNVIDQYNVGTGNREFYNGTTASPELIVQPNGLGLIAKGPVRAQAATGQGWAQAQPGSSTLSGYMVVATPDGNQQGYIGGSGNGTHLPLTATAAAGGIDLFVGATKIASFDAAGNFKAKGTVTASTTP